jgi:hypothetical protein
MSQPNPRPARSSGRRALWFVLLWLAGVAGMALIVLPFHVLISMAIHH